MGETKGNPAEINSFYVISKLRTNPDFNKKRKLPAELLGLPSSKHKHCSEGGLPSKSAFPYGGRPETERMNVQFRKGNLNVMCFGKGLRPGSAKESNSFGEEADSATSVFCGAKFEPSFDCSSTQSINCDGETASSESTQSSLESSTAMESSSTEQEVAFVENRIETIHKLQEHLLELDNHGEYNCAEYGNDDIEQCTDQELGDLFYSNELNPNAYILSSGRWSDPNHEAQSRAKTPTIDQEFEQYFSMLML